MISDNIIARVINNVDYMPSRAELFTLALRAGPFLA